ncbi:hypothetical protein [Streptomyces cacaoi]|uniref:hypothetical protein n=1 Tax=Streptomyces cacaoi TaxID=1898 RepID=UPI0011F3621D|nr:hypothetical protein [Streptomyces cacaoi]
MSSTITVTDGELQEIFDRLARYLPANLERVEPPPSNCGSHSIYGVRYSFQPFTGREDRPKEPAGFWHDPKLAYPHLDREAGRPEADKDEYDLRDKARFFLSKVYDQAAVEWQKAAHVAELQTVVKDTDARWKALREAKRVLDAAYSYLRTPAAAGEWAAAVSRLVDAQDAYLAAAVRFDERAREIAEVHSKHRGGYLRDTQALEAAGYPGAMHWTIACESDYGKNRFGEYAPTTTAGQAQALIGEQEDHLLRVVRLTGVTVG